MTDAWKDDADWWKKPKEEAKPSQFGSIAIRVSPFLEGQKRPVLSDGVLIVSPAMMDLIKNADEKELEHLLKNLFAIEIPGLFKMPEWPPPPQLTPPTCPPYWPG